MYFSQHTMIGIMKIYMLFIGSNIIIVASMSNFASEKNQTSTAESDVTLNKNGQRNIESMERTRRLIPFMAFYIPTSSREYLPTSPYGHINKQMNPYLYPETATIPTNHNPQHLYLPAVGEMMRKPTPRLPAYLDEKIKKVKQPQKLKNVYVNPLVDVVIPQQSYQLNSDVFNNEPSGTQLIRPAAYVNENRVNNNLTPFLPSNQLPGPFRPILSPKNYTLDSPIKLSNTNHMRFSPTNTVLKESLPIAVTSNQQFTQEGYYIASTSTEQPITSNGIDDAVHQVYVLEPIVKPEITEQKSIIKQVYDQHAPNRYKSTPKSIHMPSVPTKINYDLDPDDGYGGRVLLPYESYYTKDYKNSHPLQSTVQPGYLQKPTPRPMPQNYHFNPEPYDTHDTYDTSMTTGDTYQHLTETTPTIQSHRNQSAVDINAITYDNLIATSSSKPLHEVLNNLNKTSLQLLLTNLKENNYLPKTFTMNKLDNSLRTLAKVLTDMKKTQKPIKAYPYPNNLEYPSKVQTTKDNYHNVKPSYPLKSKEPPGPQSGVPGIDYPIHSTIPKTSFNCSEQRYKGFFGDPDTFCQVWHYCDLNGGQASFLCPNGTIFSQVLLTCDWWFNVKCSSTAQLYVLNERLYKYILPINPKFPEDYSGPLVDKYLAIKFQEMEEKMQHERNRNRENNEEQETSTENIPTEYTSQTDNTISTEDSSTEDIVVATAPTTEPTTLNQQRYYQTTTIIPPVLPPLPPPPKFDVESERVEVIEIRSDGTSGHLTPGRNRR